MFTSILNVDARLSGILHAATLQVETGTIDGVVCSASHFADCRGDTIMIDEIQVEQCHSIIVVLALVTQRVVEGEQHAAVLVADG